MATGYNQMPQQGQAPSQYNPITPGYQQQPGPTGYAPPMQGQPQPPLVAVQPVYATAPPAVIAAQAIPGKWGQYPVPNICPSCSVQNMSKPVADPCTILNCAICFCTGCFCVFCCSPCTSDFVHHCGNCNQIVGYEKKCQ